MKRRNFTMIFLILLISLFFAHPSIIKIVHAEETKEYRTIGKTVHYGGYTGLSVHILTGLTTIKVDSSGNKYVDLEGGSTLGISISSITKLDDASFYRSLYMIRILVHVYDYTRHSTVSVGNILGGSAPVFEKENDEMLGVTYNVVMDAASLVADYFEPGSGVIFDMLAYLYDTGGMTISTDGSTRIARWRSGTGDIHDSQECYWDGFIRGLSSQNSRIYKIGIDVEVVQYYNFRFWTLIMSNNIYVNGIPSSDGSGSGGGTKPIDVID